MKTADHTARDAWRDFIDALMPGLDSLNNLADMLGQLGADQAPGANLRQPY